MLTIVQSTLNELHMYGIDYPTRMPKSERLDSAMARVIQWPARSSDSRGIILKIGTPSGAKYSAQACGKHAHKDS